MMKHLSFLIVNFMLFTCSVAKTTKNSKGYASENLVIQQITDHVYQHISYLDTKDYGKVSCNGMVFIDEREAVIFDTPTDKNSSLELISWVQDTLNCKIKAVIPTHFHSDCLGGLPAFHQHQIPSYANNLTIALAKLNNVPLPQNGFDDRLELKVGHRTVVAEFLGEGHTTDNIIGYLPYEKIMFGGCLIKEVGANKGNLNDANIHDWPLTVAKLKEKYPDVKIVVPGHGKTGGLELLDYTIKLFEGKM